MARLRIVRVMSEPPSPSANAAACGFSIPDKPRAEPPNPHPDRFKCGPEVTLDGIEPMGVDIKAERVLKV
ncbi:hypothetical protein SAMN05444166_6530 [Singulisphaera sp. GP187]|nr:hypothetical protein SAMN05444166_6530 [Singulisphaera sp. GP187]